MNFGMKGFIVSRIFSTTWSSNRRGTFLRLSLLFVCRCNMMCLNSVFELLLLLEIVFMFLLCLSVLM